MASWLEVLAHADNEPGSVYFIISVVGLAVVVFVLLGAIIKNRD